MLGGQAWALLRRGRGEGRVGRIGRDRRECGKAGGRM